MSANQKNGHRRGQDKKVRVAIVGVGNCASSLVQGVHYYRDASTKESVPGLMHVDLGGYHIRDIEFVAAFDIDKNKVGLDLSEAIFAKPNNTVKFADVPRSGVKVQRGMTHDGIGKYLSEIVKKAPAAKPEESGTAIPTGEAQPKDPLLEIKILREHWNDVLENGPVDQNGKRYGMPIEKAKEEILKQGLPVRKQ